MERRRDYRHPLRCALSLKCPQTRRVIDDLHTSDVSASGLSFEATVPHGLLAGERLEIQLVAPGEGQARADAMVMATHGVVVRSSLFAAALEFEAPLAY